MKRHTENGIFESVEFLNEGLFGFGKKKTELNSDERQEVLKSLKTSIKELTGIKGLSFYNNFDAEQFIDGYDDMLLIASFDITEGNSVNDKVMRSIEAVATKFNKEHKGYKVKIDWDKYEGTYFLYAR